MLALARANLKARSVPQAPLPRRARPPQLFTARAPPDLVRTRLLRVRGHESPLGLAPRPEQEFNENQKR